MNCDSTACGVGGYILPVAGACHELPATVLIFRLRLGMLFFFIKLLYD